MNNLVGQTVTVGCSARQPWMCFDNVHGGTGVYEGRETFECVVQDQWHDYECGWRLIGSLTPHSRKQAEALGFVPNRIYFSESNAIAGA